MDNASESPQSFSELILLGPGKTKAQEIMKVVASVHRVPGDLENLTSSHSEILRLLSQLHDISSA